MSNSIISPAGLVAYRQNSGLRLTDVAIAMSISRSAVARLEKRLLSDADVSLKALRSYAEAVGVNIHITFAPKPTKPGLFKTAAAAIKFAVHSSACEGMTTPPEDIENLWRLARGEISADDLIKQYISEAIEEDRKSRER